MTVKTDRDMFIELYERITELESRVFAGKEKATPPPLRVEDVPLGFPCRLKDGREFVPHYVDSNNRIWGLMVGLMSGRFFATEGLNISMIDPASIIPTREVWLNIYPDGRETCVHTSAQSAVNGRYDDAFTYGPIRIPLKPVTP